ncbi:MAG TPA: ABC transporter permease subunit, partial [Candidatus Nitrosotenuis sp.]|nr:ABC transporter permease subunit [Candidatus Nitrosotenuis sp.]
SIILGLYIYEVYVVRVHNFSALAGMLALSLIVIPIIIRVTEDTLLLIPPILKENALALGATKYETIRSILLILARSGILTGFLLAAARISGEAAPVLFTALNNQFWNVDITKPIANLPTVIYQYVMSPYDEWQQLAWCGAMLITLWVLVINLVARFTLKRDPGLF